MAGSEVECKQIWRETGISHMCIFSLLPYFDMAHLVLHGFMHAVYINLFKSLIGLWCGNYKGLDSGTSNYVILGQIWCQIRIETRQAVRTILAAFVQSIPNIDTDFSSFTTEDNIFWLTWLMLYLLADCLPKPYYLHLLDLINVIKVCTGFGMTREEISNMGTNLYKWCLIYEE